MPPQQPNKAPRKRKLRRWIAAALVLGLLGYGGWRLASRELAPQSASAATFRVLRGPLDVTVVEGGSVEAKDKLEILCEVQGSTKILSIVEEGKMITPEDVEKGLVLIELDSKQLLDQQVSQELDFQTSLAALTRAKEQYDIQLIDNESTIKAAELAVKFAEMDLAAYVGEELAAKIVAEAQKIEDAARLLTQQNGSTQPAEPSLPAETPPPTPALGEAPAPEPPPAAPPANGGDTGTAAEAEAPEPAPPPIDAMAIVKLDNLGDGQARQKIRGLENDLVLSEQDLSLAQVKLEGTKRLFEKEFVTKNQLDSDQAAYDRKVIALETAQTSKELFTKYEFPKMVEKLVSDYQETLRKLRRNERMAVSRSAQEEADRVSAEARHLLQTRKRQEIAEQIEKCVIRAVKPGLVIYGTGESSYREEIIEAGANVRERQVLITIPDMSVLALTVKVHESVVQLVKSGQKVRVRVDAFPAETLTGVVHSIAPLPDTTNRWMNPDVKVYETKVYLDEAPRWLRPGMSAEAEILVERHENVLQVPIQAVSIRNDRQVCFVKTALGVEERPVETGAMGLTMAEIKSGVEEGETVLLRAPALPGDAASPGEKQGRPAEEGKEGGKEKAEKGRREKRPESGEAPEKPAEQ